MMQKIFTIILITNLLFACKKDDTAPQFHYEYFDLTPGRYIDYEVTDIYHDVNQTIEHDTSRYFLRTVIGDTVFDNLGRVARKFIRYKRQTSSDPWVMKDVWTAIIDGLNAELVEENQRLIKLVFAPTLQKSWNVNAFNTLDQMEAYYTGLHKNRSINGLSFDSTLVVELENEEPNFIEYKRKYEVYAKGVGMIERSYKDLRIVNFDTLNITSGKESFYRCIAYGFQ